MQRMKDLRDGLAYGPIKGGLGHGNRAEASRLGVCPLCADDGLQNHAVRELRRELDEALLVVDVMRRLKALRASVRVELVGLSRGEWYVRVEPLQHAPRDKYADEPMAALLSALEHAEQGDRE